MEPLTAKTFTRVNDVDGAIIKRGICACVCFIGTNVQSDEKVCMIVVVWIIVAM